MLPGRRTGKFTRARRGGFTLIEVTLATLLVGVLLVAALNTVGSATRGQVFNAQRSRAGLLADALLAEIVELPYADPQGGTGLGPDTGEGTTTRADFDDVDDYHGWTATPPADKQGTSLASGTGLTRSVTVNYVDPDDLGSVQSTDKGAKRIVVNVAANGNTLVSLTTVVTDH